MARLPYAGGRNGMGTTAVENDFLSQLEEAHGAGDEMIAATLAGEPSPIRGLPAMLVQSSREEMRGGSASPPEQTVREELAMSALNSGLGSRPRNFVPPLSRMSKGGQTPRYNQGMMVPGASGTTQDPLEEEELGYPQRMWNYAKEHPYQAAFDVGALGSMFIPVPGARVAGAGRLGTSVGGRLLWGASKPIRSAGGRLLDKFRKARTTRGEKFLEANPLPTRAPTGRFMAHTGPVRDAAVRNAGTDSLALSAVGYGLPAVAGVAHFAGSEDDPPSSGEPVGKGIAASGVKNSNPDKQVKAEQDRRLRAAKLTVEARQEGIRSLPGTPKENPEENYEKGMSASLGGDPGEAEMRQAYIRRLLGTPEQKDNSRRDRGEIFARMAGALLTPEAEGGGMGAMFNAAAEGASNVRKGERDRQSNASSVIANAERNQANKEVTVFSAFNDRLMREADIDARQIELAANLSQEVYRDMALANYYRVRGNVAEADSASQRALRSIKGELGIAESYLERLGMDEDYTAEAVTKALGGSIGEDGLTDYERYALRARSGN